MRVACVSQTLVKRAMRQVKAYSGDGKMALLSTAYGWVPDVREFRESGYPFAGSGMKEGVRASLINLQKEKPMSDSADAMLWTQGRDAEHAGRDRRANSDDKREITDTEKFGREMIPLNSLEAARKEPERINMAREERLISIIGGAALIAYGIARWDRAGLAFALAGGGFAFRGMTGHCPMYGALNVSTALGDSRETKGVHVAQTITINESAEELYGFWRNFENHALISDYLASVKVTGPTTSHWVAKGPANRPLEWDAEIINDRPNELIAWKTLPGADIEHAGTVRFKPGPEGRGTEVHVTMQYYPPAGRLGAGIALLFHREPSIQTADMLKRLKRLMETGDIIRVDGQSHGRSLQRAAIHPKS